MKHNENFIATIISGIATWAITAQDIVTWGKVLTVVIGVITAVFFSIKTFNDMKRSINETKKAEQAERSDRSAADMDS